MISISLATRQEPEFQRRFGAVSPETLDAFCRAICRDVWSPIIWKTGQRIKADFQECRYVVLDFDSGPTIAETLEEIKLFALPHVLATTKSHQKEKVSLAGVKSPAVDRYRLVLKASDPCTERELFEYNMKRYASWFGSDPSCTDAARYYYPCVKVVSTVWEGKPLSWMPFDEDYEPEAEKYTRRAAKLEHMGKMGTMPFWIQNILDGRELVPVGGRHAKCVALGANLGRMGYDEQRIVQMILATRLADIGEADVRRAVRNGIKSELG